VPVLLHLLPILPLFCELFVFDVNDSAAQEVEVFGDSLPKLVPDKNIERKIRSHLEGFPNTGKE